MLDVNPPVITCLLEMTVETKWLALLQLLLSTLLRPAPDSVTHLPLRIDMIDLKLLP
jgi:hypothetical protein